MKTLATLAALLTPLLVTAAESSTLDLVVKGIPANAVEIVATIATAAPPAAGYDDPPPPPATALVPAVKLDAAAPAAVDPAAATPEQRQRGRRGGRGGRAGTTAPAPASRHAVVTNGASSVTLHAAVPVGENYSVRVVALQGDGSFPIVLAGGNISALKIPAGKNTDAEVSLQPPTLKLDPANPASVAPGARFTLAGVVTDAAQALGTKNRMRIWISQGAPPRENFAGTQTSTTLVTTKGNDVSFSFDLTAPKEPTTLYFQFGEIPTDFAREDGKQAPFLVLPNLGTGASALQLRVEAAKLAGQ